MKSKKIISEPMSDIEQDQFSDGTKTQKKRKNQNLMPVDDIKS